MHVVADLDGTLLNGRHIEHLLDGTPEGRARYHAHSLNAPLDVEVWNIARTASRLTVLTYRDEGLRGLTEEWLDANGVCPDVLVMRAPGDTRAAWQFKLPWILDNDVALVLEDNAATLQALHFFGVPAIACPIAANDADLMLV